MKMRNCPNCGGAVVKGAKYCRYCGSSLKKKRSKAATFFLTMLKCAVYYAIYFGITVAVEVFHEFLIIARTGINPGPVGSDSYQEFFNILSERYCEYGILSAILVLLTYFIIFTVRKKKMAQEARLNRIKTGNFLTLCVFGVSAQAVVSSAMVVIYTLKPKLEQYSVSDDFDNLLANADFLTQFLFIAVVTPLLEETVFRGLIFTRMKRVMPTGAAVLLSAIAFGAAHGNWEQFIYAFLLGIVCAAAFERFDTMWASYAVHFAFNASSYLVWMLPGGFYHSVAAMFIFAGVSLISLVIIFLTDNKPEKAEIKYEAL